MRAVVSTALRSVAAAIRIGISGTVCSRGFFDTTATSATLRIQRQEYPRNDLSRSPSEALKGG